MCYGIIPQIPTSVREGYRIPRWLFIAEMSPGLLLGSVTLAELLSVQFQCFDVAVAKCCCTECKDETTCYLCQESKFTVTENRAMILEL
jgi:hypothetical protein